uniref:Fe2OG dioxygenase domain-containing protein n=1 Tax=Bionectria ochroleuca TaxID=29856 RepID=A0A0B7K5T7_BIOOC
MALNMDKFYFGTKDEKKRFCIELLDSLKKRGFAKIRSHGVFKSVLDPQFDEIRRFFNLPLDVKMKVKHPAQATPNRGYSYVGQENVGNISGYNKGPGPTNTRDIKESIDFGADIDDLVENIEVPEEDLPNFQVEIDGLFHKLCDTQHHILSALAIALGIDQSHLLSIHDRVENELRLLHYPAIPASELRDGTATRCAEHTDFGTITLIFQDAVSGLQVEDPAEPGTFRDVGSSNLTDLILMAGDSLQRLTNDTVKAGRHRVTYPPGVDRDSDEMIPERYSMAFFAKADRTTSLLPLKQFVTEANPCRYEDVTAWEYNNQRSASLYEG